jgi:hypothetical protein
VLDPWLDELVALLDILGRSELERHQCPGFDIPRFLGIGEHLGDGRQHPGVNCLGGNGFVAWAKPVSPIDEAIERRTPQTRVGVAEEFLQFIQCAHLAQCQGGLGADDVAPVMHVLQQDFPREAVEIFLRL